MAHGERCAQYGAADNGLKGAQLRRGFLCLAQGGGGHIVDVACARQRGNQRNPCHAEQANRQQSGEQDEDGVDAPDAGEKFSGWHGMGGEVVAGVECGGGKVPF